MKQYIKNWSFLAGSDIISQILGFFIVLTLARNLTPDLYGSYSLVTATAIIFSVFANFGMAHVVIRVIARNEYSISGFIRRILAVRTCSTILALLGCYIYFLFSGSIELVFLICSFILIISTTAWDFCESVLFGKKLTKHTSIVNVCSTALWALLVVILPKGNSYFFLVLTGYTFTLVVKAFVIAFITRRELKKIVTVSNLSVISFGQIIQQSLPYLWLWGMTSLYSNVSLIFLQRHSGIQEVGYFSLGSKLTLPMIMLSATFMKVLYPILAELSATDQAKYRKIIKSYLTVIVTGGTMVAFILSLTSRFIIPIFFGKQYIPSVDAFNYLIWFTVIYFISVLIGNAMSASNKQVLLAKLTTVDTAIGICAMYIGSFYGASGLALARLCFVFIALTYHFFFLSRIIGPENNRSMVAVCLFMGLSFIITAFSMAIILKCLFFLLLTIFFVFAIKSDLIIIKEFCYGYFIRFKTRKVLSTVDLLKNN